MLYSKYLIKETDRFDPLYFPKVEGDLDGILRARHGGHGFSDPAQLLAYTGDPANRAGWLSNHPGLAEGIRSGALPTTNLAALFDSCRANPVFRRQLEDYVTARFEQSTVL